MEQITGGETPGRLRRGNTLVRRRLLPELTRRLVDEGGFSDRVREKLSRDYYACVEHRGSYESYGNLVVYLFQRELKGISLAEWPKCARVELQDYGRRLHFATNW